MIELWMAVLLMIGGPTADEAYLHTISGPPVDAKEKCEKEASANGLRFYYQYKAPQGWKLLGVFCVPLLEAYEIKLGKEI